MADNRTDDDKAKDCVKTLEQLILIRQPYEAMVEDVLTFAHHGRRKIKDKGKQKGQKTGTELYDGTPFHALTLLSDGLAGHSFSRAFRWFEYTLPGRLNFPKWSGMRAWSGKRMDEYPDVKEWLESCEEVMYAALLRSNFYDIIPEFIKDGASIGTVTAIVEEDVNAGRIIFTVPHFREGYIAENPFGEVDTYYREVTYTLKQCDEKFGIEAMEKVKPDFKNKLKNNRYEEVDLIHASYPRTDYDPELVNAKNKPFASMWVLKKGSGIQNEGLIMEGGYEESPAITWRWRKNAEEWYGRGAVWDALVDIMVLHQQARTNLVAGHKMAEPPMVAPEDLRGLVQTGPKGWTYITGGITKDNIPLPLQTGIQLPFSLEMQDRQKEVVKEHLFVDFFLMLSQAALSGKNLTATQVLEMAGEKAAVLGPRIGRLESEASNPIHDRMFAIEQRAGRIPEPPEILLEYSGDKIEIDYLGPLSQTQKKLFKSQGIRGGLEALGPLVQIHPNARHIVDPIQTAKILLESSGFPSKALRDDAAIAEAIQAEAEQQQIEQAIEQGVDIAKVLPAAGKAIEPDSPLALLTEDAGVEAE